MNEILCPYCGSEMKIEWDDFDFCAYTCPRCNSKAPRGDSIEDAYEKALQRPPQKPLTLEEACGSEEPCVFIEHLRFKSIHAADVVLAPEPIEDKCAVEIETIGTSCIAYSFADEYNKTWRCWATKPTDEEREAAKWEE